MGDLRILGQLARRVLGPSQPTGPRQFPFRVLGNKCDMDDKRKVSKQRAQQWAASKNDMPFHETSAAQAHNVDVAFQEIARRAMKQEKKEEPAYFPPSEYLTLNNQNFNNARPRGQ